MSASGQAQAALGSPQALLTDTDYENMTIQWNDCEDYEIIRKVRVSVARAINYVRARARACGSEGVCVCVRAYVSSYELSFIRTPLLCASNLIFTFIVTAFALPMSPYYTQTQIGACQVGRGKYSEVFEGWRVSSEDRVIIKCLKPVRQRKIKREIKILQVMPHQVVLVNVSTSSSRECIHTYVNMYVYTHACMHAYVHKNVKSRSYR